MIQSIRIPFGEKGDLILETGRVARQAHGAVTAQIGGTMVLASVVRSAVPKPDADFFPLQVDYREKHYAVGRIPGNFFRRESRPSTDETITARLIDRAIRPFFPKGFTFEIQVYVTILSMDKQNPAEIPALIAASAALSISDIPFSGPVAAVKIAYTGENYIVNPTFEERDNALMELTVAGTKSAIAMVESGSKCVGEGAILEGLRLGHQEVQKIVKAIEEFVALAGQPKITYTVAEKNEKVIEAVNEASNPGFEGIYSIRDKKERETAIEELHAKVLQQVSEALAPKEGEEVIVKLERQINEAYEAAFKKFMRNKVITTQIRADGRKLNEIRPINCEVKWLPMAHGSAIFTRGQTQALGVTTLGTVGDQMKVDNLMGLSADRFLMHYNFPSYSVGEVRRIMGPGRRELGHGMLAQRSLEAILPDADKFPYTIRVVSEVLESNGSSSMASVLRGLPEPHGRRCSDQGSRGGHRHGSHS